MAFRGAASTAAAAPDAPVNRSNHTGGRPAQPNLLHNPDDVSESDEEEPPPYSRYDPLTEPPSEPPPQNTPHPPRQDGSQRPYPGRAQNSYHSNLPPAPRPPFAPHSSQGSASPHAGQYSPPFQQYPPKFPQPPAPFRYPPGYYCSKCHNTGVKVYNGSPCGTCARLFGRQMADVRHVPYGYSVAPPPNAMVVQAGDPRLGGVLCGNCKGSGRVISLLFFDENCPVCLGVGRIR